MAKPSLSVIISNMKSDKSLQNPQAKQSNLKAALGKLEEKEEESEAEVSERAQFRAAMQDLIMAFHKMDVDLACEAYLDVVKLCPSDCIEDEDDNPAHDASGFMLDEVK